MLVGASVHPISFLGVANVLVGASVHPILFLGIVNVFVEANVHHFNFVVSVTFTSRFVVTSTYFLEPAFTSRIGVANVLVETSVCLLLVNNLWFELFIRTIHSWISFLANSVPRTHSLRVIFYPMNIEYCVRSNQVN